MNEKIKNILGIALIIAALLVGISSIKYVKVIDRSTEPTSFRSFRVSAVGESVTIPDVATFSFGVLTEGGLDVASLQEKNTKNMNNALNFLKEKGIDEKDIKTTHYNITPRYTYNRCDNGSCPPPTVNGYSISQNVQVKIREFNTVGEILAGVVNVGANNVSQLQFEVDDPTAVEQEARKDAIDKAKLKAEEIAEAGGFKLGRLLSIEEGFFGPTPEPYVRAFGGGGFAEDAVAPSIEAGSEEVMITVTLVYEIE